MICLLGWNELFAAEPVTVRIEGLQERLAENVRATLSMTRQESTSDAERIRYLHRQAPEEIRKALEPFGYYRPSIESSLERQDSNWLAVYRIEAGPAIPLTKVDVRLLGEGNETPAMRQLIENFPIKANDTLDQTRYEKAKSAFQDRADELGFFDARFTRHEIRVDLEAYQAEIWLHFETGRRYRFGQVSFSETPLQSELLRRFVSFQNGDSYQASKLLKLQKDLFNSSFFSRADVDPQPEQAERGEIPVRVFLGMQPKNRFQAGMGYGTDTGPRLTRNRSVLSPSGGGWEGGGQESPFQSYQDSPPNPLPWEGGERLPKE
jgi:translocation and assembly module TamA